MNSTRGLLVPSVDRWIGWKPVVGGREEEAVVRDKVITDNHQW